MATLHCIAFFLACVFLLQEIQSQGLKSFEYKEEYGRGSSSHQDNESFKKEIKHLEEQTGAIMAQVCQPLKLLGMSCQYGAIGRRSSGSILGSAMRFVHAPIRILHGVVYICGRIISCLLDTIRGIARKIIESIPECLRDIYFEIKAFLKTVIEKIGEVLNTVYDFVKDVVGCAVRMISCAKDKFERVSSAVIRILRTVIASTTVIVKKVVVMGKETECQKPAEGNNPVTVIIQCGQCVYCPFKPDTPVCQNQQINQQIIYSQESTMYT